MAGFTHCCGYVFTLVFTELWTDPAKVKDKMNYRFKYLVLDHVVLMHERPFPGPIIEDGPRRDGLNVGVDYSKSQETSKSCQGGV